ncbi:TPA: hypothetical protein DDW35_14000 [Candidatus Sumerlaeota bacterium]|nr:hypothetical protein [Candidatus Sumerlaeota bacterium]
MTPLCRCTTCRAQLIGVDWVVSPKQNGWGAKEKQRDMSRNGKSASCCRAPKKSAETNQVFVIPVFDVLLPL